MLERKIPRYRAAIVAIVGVTVYRAILPLISEDPPKPRGEAIGLQPIAIHSVACIQSAAEPQRPERELQLCGNAGGVSRTSAGGEEAIAPSSRAQYFENPSRHIVGKRGLRDEGDAAGGARATADLG